VPVPVVAIVSSLAIAAGFGTPAQALPTNWAITKILTPGHSLDSVSCVSTSFCFAVGSGLASKGISSESQTLIKEWNGHQWSTVTSPTPTGATAPILSGVSCSDTTHCVAVGNAGSPFPESFGEVWNGTSWSLASTQNPGAEGGYLAGVACPSSTMCMAVGYESAGAGGPYGPALVESWNGTAWSIAAAPVISRYGNNLESISCVNTADCTATGLEDDNGSSSNTLVERWNGAKLEESDQRPCPEKQQQSRSRHDRRRRTRGPWSPEFRAAISTHRREAKDGHPIGDRR
jgi:hypothetical protein